LKIRLIDQAVLQRQANSAERRYLLVVAVDSGFGLWMKIDKLIKVFQRF